MGLNINMRLTQYKALLKISNVWKLVETTHKQKFLST